MAFSISGLVGAGAQEGLDDLLRRQIVQQQIEQRMKEFEVEQANRQQQMDLQRRSIESVDRDREEDRKLEAKRIDLADVQRRSQSNTQQLELMNDQAETMAQQETLQQLPPHLQQLIKVRQIGGNIRPEDMLSPDERVAADEAKTKADISRAGAIADAQARAAAKYREPKPTGPGGLSNAQMTSAKQFQDDYARDSKTYTAVRNAYQQVAASATNPDAAGDLSLIFGYMKMLDPNSVVRETEFANAQNAAGVPDQVRNLYNRAVSGERLNPNQRAQFIGQARKLMEVAHGNQSKVRKTYGTRAEKFGIDPSMVLDEEEQLEALVAASEAASPGHPMQKPIPGVEGGIAESTDGGKTWKRVK